MGYSSGSSSANVTPEQTQQMQLTNQLLSTLVPTYQGVTTGAQQALDYSKQNILNAAQNGMTQASQVGQAGINGGQQAAGAASNALQNLVTPGYAQQVIAGAEQPVIEQNRELQNTQNAQFGAAGGLGSSRQALADSSLAGLNAARESAAGTSALSNIVGQQLQGASNLGTLGLNAITGGLNANQEALTYANAPQTAYSTYANTVFGIPSSASTGNYSSSQGQSSKGIKV
jgi:hypothetical protein